MNVFVFGHHLEENSLGSSKGLKLKAGESGPISKAPGSYPVPAEDFFIESSDQYYVYTISFVLYVLFV